LKSFLLSALRQRYGDAPPEAFFAEYPHDWLLWEPGAWRAPRPQTPTLSVEAFPRAPDGDGEALALVLRTTRGPGQVTLGRGDGCDMVLNDATLSQLHLVFMPTPQGGWTVRDAGSTNGSWLGERRLAPGQPAHLHPGSHIQAADVHLTFHTGASLLARLRRLPRPGEGR
jgi:FHA domain